MDDAQVDQILARLKASANVARNRTAAAAAVARGEPRVSDDLASESAARNKPFEVPEPSSSESYDFERKPEFADHGFEPETDVHSRSTVYDDPNLAETRIQTETPTTATERLSAARADAERVLANEETAATLKMKAQSRAMPQAETLMPGKSIEQLAQEDAERILGRKPMTPPEAGTMEGKSVAQEVIKVREDALNPPKPAPTPEGKILTTAEDAAQLQSELPKTPVTAAEDVTAGTIKRSVPNATQRLSARYAAKVARDTGTIKGAITGAPTDIDLAKAAKWYTQNPAARKIGEVGTSALAKGGKLLGGARAAVSDFNKASLAGKAWKATKLGWNVGKWTAKTAMKDLVVPAAAEALGEFGITNLSENLGATGRLTEMPGQGTSLGTGNKGFSSLLDAQEEQLKNLGNYNSMANKYGLKVTGRTSLMGIMGIPGLNRLIAPGPNIQVQEDPTLKAAYLARNKQRIQEMQEQWATNQAKSNSE